MSPQASNNQPLIERKDAALVIIDIQEKLMPVINHREKVIGNSARLMQFAKLIGMPILITEQDKLGPTVPELLKVGAQDKPVIKESFNSFYCEAFNDRLRQLGKKTLILTGVETHVCVAQTALYGLKEHRIHVIADAVASRTMEDWTVGLDRMRQAGAVISSTEMVIFELLQKAGTDEFRAALKLVK